MDSLMLTFILILIYINSVLNREFLL